jgi:hypothetical protein
MTTGSLPARHIHSHALARMVTVSDIGEDTAEALQEAADLLCRTYPSAPAEELRVRTRQRLTYLAQLLGGRLTLRPCGCQWPSPARLHSLARAAHCNVGP